jgi:hypothetical protein
MLWVTGFFAAFENQPARILWVIGTVFVVTNIASQTTASGVRSRTFNSDAIQSYAYLPSLVIDGDLDFTNDDRGGDVLRTSGRVGVAAARLAKGVMKQPLVRIRVARSGRPRSTGVRTRPR